MTQILFCAEKYMPNKDQVETLIRQSFPAPKYSVISLVVQPDHVALQVSIFFKKHAFSSPPLLFFYWSSQDQRTDIANTWSPLFEGCRAIALIDLMKSEDKAKDIEKYWENAWKYEQMYRIVTLEPLQQALTPQQQNALQEVCSVEVKNTLDRSRYYIFGLVALAALALIGLLFQRHHLKFHFDKPA